MIRRTVTYMLDCDHPTCNEPDSMSACESRSRVECYTAATASGWRLVKRKWYCPTCAAKFLTRGPIKQGAKQ